MHWYAPPLKHKNVTAAVSSWGRTPRIAGKCHLVSWDKGTGDVKSCDCGGGVLLVCFAPLPHCLAGSAGACPSGVMVQQWCYRKCGRLADVQCAFLMQGMTGHGVDLFDKYSSQAHGDAHI